ncbi:mucin-5AC isoform X2 [Aricia agestis]|uniref:mucin-5AC isoform X2 n=1 Tax=Aricia agestis TaxID=91739 RepID=UPI001C20A613|nr:mucin-5AC isoform X2 [Aricia agestis]
MASCQTRMSTTPATTALAEELLTTTKSSTQTLASIKPIETTSKSTTPISSTTNFVTQSIATSSKVTTMKPVVSTTTTKATTALSTTTSSTSSLTTASNTYTNVTLPLQPSLWTKSESTTVFPKTFIKTYVYNRTEMPELEPKGTSAPLLPQHVTTDMTNSSMTTKIPTTFTSRKSLTTATKLVKTTIHTMTENESSTLETKTTKKATTLKSFPSTIKLKPKEIWIKPTQKGEIPIIEIKHKAHETSYTRIKSAINKNEMPTEVTTPKTIIVSIIPTSVSHASFKKIALTTVPYNMSHKNNVTSTFSKKTGVTKAIDSHVSTALPYTIKILHPIKERKLKVSESNRSLINENINKSISTPKKHLKGHTSETFNISTAKALFNTTMATSRTTNSMSTANESSGIRLNLSTLLTNKLLTNHKMRNSTIEITTVSSNMRPQYTKVPNYNRTQSVNKLTHKVSVTKMIANVKTTKMPIAKHATKENTTAKNVHKNLNSITTKEPVEDETFHILTEPEHITAVMTDKEREHTSVDLVSVVSIAGGVMMAVITVAVVIVMVERCRRPRYDDVRKMDEMRMQSMIDSDDEPPPYVRSIFHTPLPEPPSEKCHYQPITTLDRNLKQFMRPVVVQTISPVMLENFRGILECHYDHLPRRQHDFDVPLRSSITPSTNYSDELRPLSVTDTIEALKCEAKFDVIDSTTSEPLYAEIPCWRPPSEHAIEVNLNGEAVTEL